MRFDETVSRLAFSGGRDNLRAVVNEILGDGSPKQFGITVTVETTGKRTSRCSKEANGSQDALR